MRTSDSINDLAVALAAAQAEMKPAPMTGRNSILNNRYSTLSDVIETARPVLAKHGLSYVQFPKSPDDLAWNFIGLVTRLMHTSGQWIEEEVYFPMGDGNRGVTSVQVAGSTITYMRRYAVAAMLGIVADEDTDGNAQKQEKGKATPPKQAQPTPEKPAAPKTPPATNGNPPSPASAIDEDIAAAEGRAFVPLAARLIQIAEDAVKERMKALGYTAIPGKPDLRVQAFHKVREYQANPQPPLVADDPDAEPATGPGAYSEA